jgi:hypothetical protein
MYMGREVFCNFTYSTNMYNCIYVGKWITATGIRITYELKTTLELKYE